MAKRSLLRSFIAIAFLAISCCESAEAWFILPPLVFDAQRFAQQALAIRYEVQWIESLARHLENDARMLRRLDYSNLGNWTTGLQRVESAAARIDALANEPDRMARHLEQAWPIVWSGAAEEQRPFESTRQKWLERERATLADCRAAQNGVVTEMPSVKKRVSDLVERSNAADGATAALQARTQLTGELSGELAKLEALRLSRAVFRSERVAREQSASARAAAVRDYLMRRAGTIPPSEGQGTYTVDLVAERPTVISGESR